MSRALCAPLVDGDSPNRVERVGVHFLGSGTQFYPFFGGQPQYSHVLLF